MYPNFDMPKLKIKRIFHYKGKEYEQDDTCDHPVKPNAGLYVRWRGKLWQWVMYDSRQVPGVDCVLEYTPINFEPTTTDILDLGGDLPKCDCGVVSVGGSIHSPWCSVAKYSLD